MEEKYIASAKIGAAGGLLIALAFVLELVIEIATRNVSEDVSFFLPRLLSCGIYILCALIPAAAGVLIVRRAAERPGNIGGAGAISLSGGLAAGGLVVLSLLVVAFVRPFAIWKQYDAGDTTLLYTGVPGAIVNTVAVAICCAPVIFAVCVSSTVIGALAYFVATDKRSIVS